MLCVRQFAADFLQENRRFSPERVRVSFVMDDEAQELYSSKFLRISVANHLSKTALCLNFPLRCKYP
jgi:hypothetical protein